jgi:hypothetical protein
MVGFETSKTQMKGAVMALNFDGIYIIPKNSNERAAIISAAIFSHHIFNLISSSCNA